MQPLDLIHQVEPKGLIFEWVPRQRAREFAFGAVHQSANMGGLHGIGLQLEIFAEMVNGRDGILNVVQINEPRIKVRLGCSVNALGDYLQKCRQRLLFASLFHQLLTAAVGGVIGLGAQARADIALAARAQKEHGQGKQDRNFQSFHYRSGKGIEREWVGGKFRNLHQRHKP